ncbi:MAG: hypothetical protein A2V66_07180 [Ignavibacteria bacterium RBG_13_36_8]|nr:MAG: hypothetical protein A2V66_07180 [Ignavibacteria bacterium RBG_13_36_8]
MFLKHVIYRNKTIIVDKKYSETGKIKIDDEGAFVDEDGELLEFEDELGKELRSLPEIDELLIGENGDSEESKNTLEKNSDKGKTTSKKVKGKNKNQTKDKKGTDKTNEQSSETGDENIEETDNETGEASNATDKIEGSQNTE